MAIRQKNAWITGICIIAFTALLLLYPFPNKSFLYRNAESLQGRVSNLQGASIAFSRDPSFYYKFKISPDDVDITVAALGLQQSSLVDYEVRTMQTQGPLWWHFWWWQPHLSPTAVLYSGYQNGNVFYLLYEQNSQIAYLYIQNT